VNEDSQDDLPTRIDTLIGQEEASGKDDEDFLSGQTLGPFRIRRKLGEGGMGQVYLARQLHPVERDVALKLVLRKVRDRRALTRFEIEQQALAQMSHPAIAQVFDAGTTPSGYPYFAMEFVDGEPLDHYCERHRLDLTERLRLLIRICQGVQHAHQRGIIHRDLKPGNILVSTIDGVPRPKIIDFGIARATESDSGLDASARDVVGTPQYMSPEQFNLDEVVLDPRSDVYSLGVVLHELLVGCLPIGRDALSHADSETLAQVLAEHNPLPAPSTRLGSDSAADQRMAEQRRTSIRKLRLRLRSDLDAITLKALAQAREDRYNSPQELADDLDRAIGLHPVSAMPDTRAYRMRRFLQRNKLAVGSASAIALALLAGLTAATLGMLEAQRQFQIAEQRQLELEQVSRFQQAMLENLDPQDIGLTMLSALRAQYRGNPDQARSEDERVQFEAMLANVNATDIARQIVDDHLLREARASIAEQFEDQPLVQADLLASIADVYSTIGRPAPGLELWERVVQLRTANLSSDQADLLEARRSLAYTHYENDQFDQAETLLQSLMADIDLDDPQARRIHTLARNDMALVYVDQGRIDDALGLFEGRMEALAAAGTSDPELTIASTANLGYVLARAGRVEDALVEFRKVLDLTRELRGPDDPSTLRAMINVSSALGATGRHEEALEIESELLQRLLAASGREHIASIRVMSNMANNLRNVGRADEALSLLEDARRISTEVLGPLNPVTLRTELNLGSLLTFQKRLEEGYGILDSVVRDRTTVFGPDHPETLSAMEVRISNLQQQGRYSEALAQIDRVIDGRAAAFGPDHPIVDRTRWMKGLILRDDGQFEQALPILRPRAEASFAQAPRDRQTLSQAVDLYEALLLSGDVEAADAWLGETLAWLAESDPAELDSNQNRIRTRLLELQGR
jgi:non-specific serine/threonine protein kinase/serine/threonine-protein kinase